MRARTHARTTRIDFPVGQPPTFDHFTGIKCISFVAWLQPWSVYPSIPFHSISFICAAKHHHQCHPESGRRPPVPWRDRRSLATASGRCADLWRVMRWEAGRDAPASGRQRPCQHSGVAGRVSAASIRTEKTVGTRSGGCEAKMARAVGCQARRHFAVLKTSSVQVTVWAIGRKAR